MSSDQKPERRLRFYRAINSNDIGSMIALTGDDLAHNPTYWQPIPELDRLLEILPQLERLVDLYRECRLPATLAPPQPDKPLSAEDFCEMDRQALSQGFGIVGRPPHTVIVSPMPKTEGEFWTDGNENVYPVAEVFLLAREQAAAANRKEPAKDLET